MTSETQLGHARNGLRERGAVAWDLEVVARAVRHGPITNGRNVAKILQYVKLSKYSCVRAEI